MARVKIVTPEKIIGSVSLQVRISDINYGNHLGNDALISLLHEARVSWFRQGRFSEMNIGNGGTIMNELIVNYVNESFYGDILNFEISIGEYSNSSFEVYYHVYTIREDKTIVIAKAKTGMVCFDYEKRKIAPLSDDFKNFLKIL